MVARSVRDAEVPGSSPGTPTVADLSLDVAIAPDAAVTRVKSAINLPKKRVFGVLKTQAEYVGVVDGRRFEIWERQQRAVHAFGEVRGVAGGARIDVRFFLPPRTWILLAVFFVLYVIVGLGVSSASVDGVTATDIVLVLVGGLVLAALFTASALRQRSAIGAFFDRLFVGADWAGTREHP